jgi:hypothetical protein
MSTRETSTADADIARLELELSRHVEPISGRVRILRQPAREFAGMLELMALLDEARASPQDEPSDGEA